MISARQVLLSSIATFLWMERKKSLNERVKWMIERSVTGKYALFAYRMEYNMAFLRTLHVIEIIILCDKKKEKKGKMLASKPKHAAVKRKSMQQCSLCFSQCQVEHQTREKKGERLSRPYNYQRNVSLNERMIVIADHYSNYCITSTHPLGACYKVLTRTHLPIELPCAPKTFIPMSSIINMEMLCKLR